MLISVIIPVYNVKAYMECCMESILRQTYEDLQIIMVDDGSTDGSGQLCDYYAQKDHRIQVIHKENGGLVSARKAGLMLAKGEYISYVDSDDWLDLEAYQKLTELKTQADIIAFAGREEYGDGIEQGIKKNTVKEGLYETNEALQELYHCMMATENFYENGILTYLWSKLFKRDLLYENQMTVPDDVSYGEDAACVYPCLLKARSILITNMPLYHYRIRSDSMVGSKIGQEKLSLLFDTLKISFLTHPLKKNLAKQLKYFMLQTMLLKCYQDIKHSVTLFPFEKVQSGMRVAVYGAGLFGRIIGQALSHSNLITAGWFDKRYESYADQGFPVRSPNDIYDANFDIIVIAVLNIRSAKQIKSDLVHFGIPADKIDYISMSVIEEMDLPQYRKDILDIPL